MNCGRCCCVFRGCGTGNELWSVLLCVQREWYRWWTVVCVAVCSDGVLQVMNCGLCWCITGDELWSVLLCSEGVVQVMNCGLCCCVFRWCITGDEMWSVLLCSEGVVQVMNYIWSVLLCVRRAWYRWWTVVCVAVCSDGVLQVMNCGLCCCMFRWCITGYELWSVLLSVQRVWYM